MNERDPIHGQRMQVGRNDPQDPSRPYGKEPKLTDLPESVQVEAIAKAIRMLAQDGYSPFDATDLSEALGPEQLRLVAEAFGEDQLRSIAAMLAEEEIGDGSGFEQHLAETLVGDLTDDHIARIADKITLQDLPVEEDSLKHHGPIEDTKSDQATSDQVVDEVNKRVVAPLILGTATLLLAASIGAMMNGSILLGVIILPGPVLGAWSLWKMANK